MSVGHKQLLVMLDALAYTVALLISAQIIMFIYGQSGTHSLMGSGPNSDPWVWSLALLLPVYIFLMTVSNMYVYWRRVRDEFIMVSLVIIASTAILTFGSSAVVYIERGYSSNIMFFVHAFLIPSIFLAVWILIAMAVRCITRSLTAKESITIIVSTIDDVVTRMGIVNAVYKDISMKYHVTNFYSLDGSDVQEVRISDTRTVKAHPFADKHRPRVALVVVDEVITPQDQEAISVARDGFIETILMHKVTPSEDNEKTQTLSKEINSHLFYLGKGWHKSVRRGVKRTVDLLIVAVVSVVAVPVILALMVIIRLDSKGSPIYKHRRVGFDGQDIDVFKLRTMYLDSYQKMANILASNEEARIEWKTYRKLKNDPRVTRVGKIIRKLSLDELPQILNIIAGNMSFVGPRPVTQEEIESNYKDKAFYYKMVTPGLTGLWQISGRSVATYEQRILMDMIYVQRNSLLLDGLIVLKTPFKLISLKGSY